MNLPKKKNNDKKQKNRILENIKKESPALDDTNS